MDSIAVIVVTYNRLNLLQGCIASLESQTRNPDKIIVVNNGSSDGTDAWLDSQAELLVIHQQNLGGAGGFHSGIKAAYENGYDWIWIMDDDCNVANDCLEQMWLSVTKAKTHAVAPIVLDRDGVADERHRGYFDLAIGNENILKPVGNTNSKDVKVDFASFVGLMVNARIIRQIGFPRADFFIHNDDVEYCIRIKKVSEILLSSKAKIYHLENAINTNINRKFFNHYRERPPLEKLWIRYYGVRNAIWIKKRYLAQGSVKDKLSLLFFITKAYSKHFKDILMYDDDKLKRAAFYFHAYADGWTGTFNNNAPKQLLKASPSPF